MSEIFPVLPSKVVLLSLTTRSFLSIVPVFYPSVTTIILLTFVIICMNSLKSGPLAAIFGRTAVPRIGRR